MVVISITKICGYGGNLHNTELHKIVMEYCEAGSVGDILKITNTAFTEEQISKICRQVLKVKVWRGGSNLAGLGLHPQ